MIVGIFGVENGYESPNDDETSVYHPHFSASTTEAMPMYSMTPEFTQNDDNAKISQEGIVNLFFII